MDESVKNGLVFELGGGKDGLMYPASGTSPALVLDASGNGNNGVNSGAVLVDSDTALSFDGVNNNNINCASVANSNFTGVNGFTLSAWIYIVGYGQSSFGRIIDKTDSFATTNGFSFAVVSASGLKLSFNLNGATYGYSNIINFNTWYFVTATVTATGNVTFYVNASVSGSPSQSTKATTDITTVQTLRIGNNAELSRDFDGYIKQVKIHSKVLSESEITTIYNGGIVSDGLVLDLPMNRLNCRTNSGIDTAGNNTITNSGATLTADHNGRANRGWQFSNASAHNITVTNTKAYFAYMNSGNPYSIITSVAWLDRNTVGSRYYIAYNTSNPALKGIQFGLLNMAGVKMLHLKFLGLTSGSFLLATLNNYFPDDNLYHQVGIVFLAWNNIRIYLDGNFISTLTLSSNLFSAGNSSEDMQFGYAANSKTDRQIFINRGITDSEIKKLYNYWRSH